MADESLRNVTSGGDYPEHANLIKSMDEGIAEKKAEIRKKAEEAAEAIRCEAKARAAEARKSRADAAAAAADVGRNHELYSVQNELNREMTALKHRLFDQAFSEAAKLLGEARGGEGYADCYGQLAAEALAGLGDGDAMLHVDPGDERLCKDVVSRLGAHCDVAPDLTCAGGLNASTHDGKVAILNTLESRLEKAKDRLKLEVFAVLFGV